MPAIQVARTDTFEQQRQKINQLGSQVFSIVQGGSDLSTGNLKLGDGSLSSPALSFISEDNLGLYKSESKILSFVSDSKKVLDVSFAEVTNFKNLNLRRKSLFDGGIVIQNSGQNYDPGNYTSIPLSGGSGSGSSANFTVAPYTGSIYPGSNYRPGSYTSVSLNGGSGTGSSISFSVDGVTGDLTPGSGYVDNIYTNISPDTSGSGSGMIIDVTVSGGEVFSVDFISIGQDYQFDDIITVNNSLLGGSGSGFSFKITSNPGKILSTTFVSYGSEYSVDDILTLPNSVDGISATITGTEISNLSSIDGISIGYFVSVTSGTASLPELTIVENIDEINEIITINNTATIDGTAVITFIPPWGDPIDAFSYTITNIGVISNLTITNPGSGYDTSDILTVNPQDLTTPITYSTIVKNIQKISFVDTYPTSTFSVGDKIKLLDSGVNQFSLLTSTEILSEAGQSYGSISALNGTGSGATFNVSRDLVGIADISIANPGNSYTLGDILTIPGNLIGGSTPTDDVTIEVTSITQSQESEIYKINSSGGNISSLIIDYNSDIWQTGLSVIKTGDYSVVYTLDVVGSSEYRFFIDIGSGSTITPDITLYSGNTYIFDFSDSSNTGYNFSISKFPDGIWNPSLVSNVSTTLSQSTKQIVVSNTTGILPGMLVSVASGSGSLSQNTLVESVDSGTEITLSSFPSTSGLAFLNFSGLPYTDGITKTSTQLSVKVSDNTPNLYYYSDTTPNMGGEDNEEALLTFDENNPKTFGSGASFLAVGINSEDVVQLNIVDGSVNAISGSYQSISGTSGNINTLSSSSISSTDLNVSNITSDSLTINSPENLISGNLDIGSNFSVLSESGNLTSSGFLKTSNLINSNDRLIIQNEIISSTTGYNLVLEPSNGYVSKINSNTAFIIPSGNTSQRPIALAADGAIRYNTETTQYEGYSSSTNSWSSLGGVRDVDGNTYILAELTPGLNDNTLWFYNDNNNSLRITSEFFSFVSTKKISSPKLGLPAFSLWSQNIPVLLGQYLKYRNNLYEVTTAGSTGVNPPVHTTGSLSNGTSVLTWFSSSVSSLEFTEIQDLRVAPNKDAPLIINSSVKIGGTTSSEWNTISTLSDDLIIRPNSGKKVVIDSTTHIAIPFGNNNQRSTSTAIAGSIRYNTEIAQFEGYNGANWSSLGGVRDVDGNTYIIPETAPGENENILYFYNDNINTLQLTTTSLDFTNIDTITTSGLSNLAIDTPLITLNGNETTIDNRDLTRTFISTSKQYLDLGLSSGLVVDPVLRLDDQGDVYLNVGFGSGIYNGVKIFDSELKEFELADYLIKTETFSLTKGGTESAAKILYTISLAKGCQLSLICKSSSGTKSLATYNIIDNGSDVFHNEFGALSTSTDLFDASFNITPSNETRILISLSNNNLNGDIVEFTLITQVYK